MKNYMELLYGETTTTDEYVEEYHGKVSRASQALDDLIQKTDKDIFFKAEELKNKFADEVGLLCFKYGFKVAMQLMKGE